MKKKANTDTAHLEQHLSSLEEIVDKMEAGHLSLEESLTLFEKGVGLSKSCQNILKNAEQKIQKLVKEEDQETLADYKEK